MAAIHHSLFHLLDPPCSSRFAASLTRRSWFPARQHLSTSSSRREEKAAQPQTAAADSIGLSAPVTYISTSNDPWFNLSLEDWLLRATPRNQPVLFLYRNSPCVVIGRNQNPWKETTPRELRRSGIPLVRRRSGGGAVYHDLGNTNFSIILPRLLFTRSHGAEVVARAVRERLGIEGCGVNDRNDIIIRDGDKQFKVSGSAYKIIQHRAYHHGTMLISSSLPDLGKSLSSSSLRMESKGVLSFRSPVTTLNAHLPGAEKSSTGVDHDAFVKAVCSEFAKVYGSEGQYMEVHGFSEDDGKVEDKIWTGVRDLMSWDWQYGQTPEFTNEFEGRLSIGELSVSLSTRHALITSLTFRLAPSADTPPKDVQAYQDFLNALALSLVGKRYESLVSAEPLPNSIYQTTKWRELGANIIDWLRQTM